MKKIHPIQLNILKSLLFNKTVKYSDLKPEEMEGSQFKFHLDNLIKEGLITKLQAGLYTLSDKGKEFANRMNTENLSMKEQPKVTTVFCCVKNTSGENEYLIYKRLKNPFYGCMGFPTQKVWFGEKISETAKRGLKEETNLEGNPEFLGIRHYHVYTEKELVEDKIMFIYKIINPTGKLQNNEEGEFSWVKESDLQKFMTKPLEEFWEVFEMLNNKKEVFKEVDHTTNKF